MGLKNIVSALLPIEYREQVLGDLQERGFRLGDIASVVPKIWWSHLRRSWVVPNFAGASEDVIQRRTQRLKNWRIGWALLWFTVYASSKFLDARRSNIERWFWLVMLLVMMTAMVLRMLYQPTSNPLSAVGGHRRQVSQMRDFARFGSPYFLAVFATSRLIQTYSGEPVNDGFFVMGMACCLLLGHFRARQLQKELDSLT